MEVFSSDPLVAPMPVQIDLPAESPLAAIIDETLLMEPLLAAEAPGMRARLIETFERILAASEARAALFNDGDVRAERKREVLWLKKVSGRERDWNFRTSRSGWTSSSSRTS